MKLKAVFLFFLFLVSLHANYKDSVVRISSNLLLYDYTKPWQEPKLKNIVGSGVVIENTYILTAAHVVLGAKTIEIKKSNERKKYFAKIKYISPQADLALLEIYDKKFLKKLKPLSIASDVKAGDKIKALGFPQAKTKLSKEKGVLSKIGQNYYSLSDESLVALELDVNIKQGFSGGAILNKKDDLIGIAMQIPETTQSLAYAIPSSIINTFLEDIKDGRVDGFHSNSNSYQYLNNKALQNYYKVDKKVLLVNAIDIEEKQLKKDDVILKIDDYDVSKSSEIEFFSKFHSKPVGETIRIKLLRDGKIRKLDYKLNRTKKFLHQEFAQKPRYFVFAGLVFTPITRNYLQNIGMKQYEMNMLFYEQKRSEDLKEAVAWMQTKFYHQINKGYNSKVEIVHKVNDVFVKNFEHFKTLIKESKEKYITIELVNKKQIVLDKNEARESSSIIQKRYQIKGEVY